MNHDNQQLTVEDLWEARDNLEELVEIINRSGIRQSEYEQLSAEIMNLNRCILSFEARQFTTMN